MKRALDNKAGKEKQLLEGLLIGKDACIRGSAEAAEQARPRIEQRRLCE